MELWSDLSISKPKYGIQRNLGRILLYILYSILKGEIVKTIVLEEEDRNYKTGKLFVNEDYVTTESLDIAILDAKDITIYNRVVNKTIVNGEKILVG